MEGSVEDVEERAVPFRAGDEVLVTIVEPHMYEVDDAVAKIDGYIVSVAGGGRHVGEKRLVRIVEAGRTAATAVLVDNGAGAPASAPAKRPARARRAAAAAPAVEPERAPEPAPVGAAELDEPEAEAEAERPEPKKPRTTRRRKPAAEPVASDDGDAAPEAAAAVANGA